MGVKFNPAILKSVETHGEGVLVFDRICCCIKKRSCSWFDGILGCYYIAYQSPEMNSI